MQAAVEALATQLVAELRQWHCAKTQEARAACQPQQMVSMGSDHPLDATTSPLAWAWFLLSSLETQLVRFTILYELAPKLTGHKKLSCLQII